MVRVPHTAITSDSAFLRKIEQAKAKAQAACDKEHARLGRQEDKLLKKLEAIRVARGEIFATVYRPIFDPIEEEAYAEAEQRLSQP